jgi:hypothetical protein
MTSTQQSGVSTDRIKDVSGIKVNHLECSICHDVLWKPIACQSCETPFCSACMHRWLSDNPNKCPNRTRTENVLHLLLNCLLNYKLLVSINQLVANRSLRIDYIFDIVLLFLFIGRLV